MLDKKWITVKQASQLIGVAESHIRTLCIKQVLKSFKATERLWLIDRKEAQYMADNPCNFGRPRKNSKRD